jgi:prepilin-type N-terminal cleavage/methylation domain-containing protein
MTPRDETRAFRWLGGFTLLEVLVVVSILAVLAGLLFPVLAAARDKAYQVTCLAQMRQITTAHHLYIQHWDKRFPDWVQRQGPDFDIHYRYWPELLQPYGLSEAVCRDPAFSGSIWPDAGKKLAD